MRRLVLTLPVAALAFACTSPDAPPDPRPETVDAGRLDIGDDLAGRAISEESDGPWQIRTTRSVVEDRETASKKARTVSLGAEGAHGGVAMALESEGGPPAPAKSPMTPGAEPATGGGGGDRGVELERLDDVTSGLADMPEAVDHAEPAAEKKPAGRLALDARAPADGAASRPARQLKAGSTDDNADYDAYLEFLATWVDRKEIQELHQSMDVSDRRFVRVVDVDGRPVPGAVVSIVDELADRVLWTATTYGDGRVPYYPHLDVMPVGAGGPLLIEAFVRDADGTPRGVRAPWDGEGAEVQVALPDPFELPEPIQLDVCFVIDTTGSMGDEIDSIKASLLKVTEKLRGLDREFDLRYAAVLYRDIGDDYVTATHAFTEDIEAFDEALRGVGAAGGGDGPESLNQAVAQAVDGVSWRDGAAKVAFLIADAPPHMDYAGDVPYGESARAALARGIRIHSVAASGLDPVGTLVFRQIAQFTRGKFIFIEYGGAEASAESHGVSGAVQRDNLEDILFEQIRDEVATFGR
jgi:hypothetical protein